MYRRLESKSYQWSWPENKRKRFFTGLFLFSVFIVYMIVLKFTFNKLYPHLFECDDENQNKCDLLILFSMFVFIIDFMCFLLSFGIFFHKNCNYLREFDTIILSQSKLSLTVIIHSIYISSAEENYVALTCAIYFSILCFFLSGCLCIFCLSNCDCFPKLEVKTETYEPGELVDVEMI